MSRVSKWKLEKNKVKVVFRLQFQATHVPHSGWDKLFISFIPADTGKASAKTTKANVRNGMCKWADPIYETTRLLQDSKTKQYDDKLYKIVVAMGSTRASNLGEATINLVDYIDALKPSAVTLPLHGCNFGTVLHVTIQLLTSKTGFREFEQQRELRESGIQSGADSHSPPVKIPSSEAAHTNDQTDEVSSRVKYTIDASDLSPLEQEVNPYEEYADSSNTSGSFYAEKHENEIDSLKSTLSGDLPMLSHTQSPHTLKENPSDCQNMSSIGSVELAMAFEENNRLKGSLELAESSLFDLKLEVSSLQTLADELGSETQIFSHKLSAEISSSQELANEVSIMKSECLKFKDEIIKLKDTKSGPTQIPIGVMESKIRELQSKPHLNKFEALCDFLLEFKLGYGKAESSPFKEVSGNGLGLDLCQPGNILQNFSNISPVSVDAMKEQILDLVRELDESKVEKEGLTRKMNQMELYYEALIHELEENQKRLIGELQNSRNEHSACLYTLSISKSETDSLRHDMNQQMLKFSELEALNEELERRTSTSEAALRRARLNYSIAVDKLQKDLQVLSSQVISMFETNENLIKQALPSNDDDVARLSKFQNQNSDILLEDLKRSLCVQEEHYQKVEKELIEMYSSNLNLDIYSSALQETLCEADADIRIKNEKMDELVEELKISTDSQNELMIRLQKATNDIHTLNEYNSSSISQCSDMALQNQLLEDKLMTNCEESYLLAQKVKDLEIYQSKYEACSSENAKLFLQLKQEGSENEKLANEMSLLKENINFVQDRLANLLASYNTQFCHMGNIQSRDLESMDVKNSILRLEKIQENASAKYCEVIEENQNLKSDMALQNQLLEDKLVTTCGENDLLAQKVKDLENNMMEYQSFQSKYETCLAENVKVTNEMSLLKEKLIILKDESDELVSSKVKINFVQDKLANLLASYNIQFRHVGNFQSLDLDNADVKDTILRLEEIQENVIAKYTEVMEENQNLKSERAIADVSLSTFRAEIGTMKQKFKSGLQHMETKLDVSNALVDKLQAELESVANKLHLSSEIEEKYADLNKVLLADLTLLEDQMQDLTCKNGQLAQEMSSLDDLAQELEMNELTISKLMHDKQQLQSEISSLKETSKNLHGELNNEKAYKDELEREVRDLTLHLNEVSEKLFDLEQTKSNLELDKSRLARRVSQQNAFIEEIKRNNLKSQLLEMHDYSLTADIKLIYVASHYEALIEDLVQKLARSDLEAQKKLLPDSNFEKLALQASKIECLENELSNSAVSNEELEISVLVLESKIHEQLTLLEEYNAQCGELAQDLEMNELTISKLMHDKQQLQSEISSLKETSKFLHDELNDEKAYKDELEREVRDLSLHLNEVSDKLFDLEQKKSDLELDKSRLARRVSQQNGFIEEIKRNNFKSQLLEMHDYSLTADIKLIYVASHYEALIEELVQKHARSDLEASEAQKKLLSNSNFEKFAMQASEIERLENELSNSAVSNEELETSVLVLRSKIHEQLTLLEEYNSRCEELSHKLSEQVMKTKEFKDLSTHLKEHKEKIEAGQESLRIAFIKEQCETQVQELKQQVSISKKHGEEMLLKLQDAIDEIENRKKSEAMTLKRNEELLLRLTALETELRSALAEKREKSNAYDRAKAELECALLSLECCKEEKEKLGAEKSSLSDELNSVKGQLENFKCSANFEKDERGSLNEVEHGLNGSAGNVEKENFILIPDGENADSNEPVQLQITRDAAGMGQPHNPELLVVEEMPQSENKNLDIDNEHSGAQILRSTMEHLHQELEKMKTENKVFNISHDIDPNIKVLQREIMKLHKANEELGSMFPLFTEFSGGGNALERVLALEIELAEALKSKNKSNVIFQSSFLKQHSDEEAVFKSFRDINELIKEMLELKERHAAQDAELREMHDRYSQLSLQFAEVEGERQKLKITLKNVRGSRKNLVT
ncbi:hypothetical protein CASFOL_017205 [Castilleja foliolosa]|uniref:C2 NT-type domain-containing protein n=1 Tax=Castilleja foliolosa TaxID=1961234 RepID=A0ABD3DAE3_9LAMI